MKTLATLLLLFSLPAFAQDRLCIDVAQWEAAVDDLPVSGDWRAQADHFIMSLEGGDDRSQWRMMVEAINEQGRAIRAIQADVARLKIVRPVEHHYHPTYQVAPQPSYTPSRRPTAQPGDVQFWHPNGQPFSAKENERANRRQPGDHK